jgi:hypothetical protein
MTSEEAMEAIISKAAAIAEIRRHDHDPGEFLPTSETKTNIKARKYGNGYGTDWQSVIGI